MNLPDREPWHRDALCTQVDSGDLFFPEWGWDGSVNAAKKTCRACPVRVDCLDYALTNEEAFGIWGGLTAGERRKVLKGRREHDCGHAKRIAGCGGCDPAAIEFVIEDGGTLRAFDAELDLLSRPGVTSEATP